MKIVESKIIKIIREEIAFYLHENRRPSSSVWEGDESAAVTSEDNNSIFAIGAAPVAPSSFGGTEANRKAAAREAALGLAARKIISSLEESDRCITKYCVTYEGEEDREYNNVPLNHVVVIIKVRLSDITDTSCQSSGIEIAEEVECGGERPSSSSDTSDAGYSRATAVEIGPSSNCQESIEVEIDGTEGLVCISQQGNLIVQIGGEAKEYSLVGRAVIFSSDVTILSISRDESGTLTLNGSTSRGAVSEELTDRIAREIKAGVESNQSTFEIQAGGKTLIFNLVAQQ